MARKTKTLVCPFDDRDKDKTFIIREMPALQAERWGLRLMEALAASGVYIPPDLGAAGMMGVAVLGFNAILGAPFEKTGPLLDEMFTACVTYMPDPKKPKIMRGAPLVDGLQTLGPLIDEDIEEVRTRLWLRSEVFELHTGFSIAAYLSKTWSEMQAALMVSQDTKISESSVEQSSQPDAPL